MLTPEQIKFIREWAESGNAPRDPYFVQHMIPLALVVYVPNTSTVVLNSAGLTIAAQSAELRRRDNHKRRGDMHLRDLQKERKKRRLIEDEARSMKRAILATGISTLRASAARLAEAMGERIDD